MIITIYIVTSNINKKNTVSVQYKNAGPIGVCGEISETGDNNNQSCNYSQC